MYQSLICLYWQVSLGLEFYSLNYSHSVSGPFPGTFTGSLLYWTLTLRVSCPLLPVRTLNIIWSVVLSLSLQGWAEALYKEVTQLLLNNGW